MTRVCNDPNYDDFFPGLYDLATCDMRCVTDVF